MKAYICDRCEKTYTENKTPTSGRIHGGYLAGFNFRSELREVDACVDLCDNCLNDLFDFMMNKTVFKHEETRAI